MIRLKNWFIGGMFHCSEGLCLFGGCVISGSTNLDKENVTFNENHHTQEQEKWQRHIPLNINIVQTYLFHLFKIPDCAVQMHRLFKPRFSARIRLAGRAGDPEQLSQADLAKYNVLENKLKCQLLNDIFIWEAQKPDEQEKWRCLTDLWSTWPAHQKKQMLLDRLV